MRVTVIGTGYVGLVTGTCLADMGNDVVCHDIDERKVGMLERGEMPIFEPGLEEMVRRNARDGRLSFTTNIETATDGCQICFIAVGTPPDEDGSADRRHVMGAARAIGEAMTGPLVVVVKSTVPVGTCDMVEDSINRILEERGVSHALSVVSNPEFLREGQAIEDFTRPDRVVVGTKDDRGLEAMRSLYSYLIRSGHAFIAMDVRSSEMSKYAANVMLATRLSLMNELALMCDQVGADIMNVRRGIGSDRRIGMPFLYPGIGFGGSCFPKDVKALSRMAIECDSPGNILDAVERVNRYQRVMLANRIVAKFNGNVRGKRFALWGLAFKPRTDDIREAPAITILKRLTDSGAEVCVYDPEAVENAKAMLAENARVSYAANHYQALEGAEALILATEWAVFRKPDWQRVKAALRQPIIFDGRNQYEPAEMAELGFDYTCIGRPKR